MTATDVQDIVVLGAGHAGLQVANYLLRHTLPALHDLQTSGPRYRLTLVAPSAHFYNKPGSVRAIAVPSLVGDPDADVRITDSASALKQGIIVPIAPQFAHYPANQFQFIQGTATAVNEAAKTVTIKPIDAAAKTITQSYTALIIATGTSLPHPIWSPRGDITATMAAYKRWQAAFAKADTIAIGGGGPTGVESAAELAEKHPNKRVILIFASDHILKNIRQDIAVSAEARLRKLGVELMPDTRVVRVERQNAPSGSAASMQLPAEEASEPVTLHLSNGQTQQADLYLPAVGATLNTEFLPKSWLDDAKKVAVDPKVLRSTVTPFVYAVGDVSNWAPSGIPNANYGIKPVARTVGRDLAAAALGAKGLAPGDQLETVWGSRGRKGVPPALKRVDASALLDSGFITLGSSGGVGQANGWRLPSLLLWYAKARHMNIDKAHEVVHGSSMLSA